MNKNMDTLIFKSSYYDRDVYERNRDGYYYLEIVTITNGKYPSEEDIINRKSGVRISLREDHWEDKFHFYLYNDYQKDYEYVDPTKKRFNELVESAGLYEAVQYLISVNCI